ncbi:MAG TPA: DUF692 domain-containing protein [Gammaproteobacteria bacterium]|nr:DUF692 domain-containing protein [Gammaproteobacteria bacterium]
MPMPVPRQPALQTQPIPAQAGIGLRRPHYHQVIEETPAIAWLEVHSENFFCAGGPMLDVLERVRREYPLSLHGVGLSLGSSDTLNHAHLLKLRQLIERSEPALVSEHLCWGAIGDRHLNDLLPLPYTEEALALMTEHVQEAQTILGRELLIENVSSYLTYTHSTIPEWEFLAALAQGSGCGILLDVNNIYVNAINHGFDAHEYLRAIPREYVKEIHLAGFTAKQGLEVELLIDTHSRPVSEPVWQLYAEALKHCGPVPTLIEWDQDIPELPVLMSEAGHARSLLDECLAVAA